MNDLLVCDALEVPLGRDRSVLVEAVRVREGETVAILGPNGAGKSSLLEALAGLRPHGGRIHRSGESAFLPQRPVLFRGTVLRNAALPLLMRGEARREAEARAREALAALGVEHLASRRAHGLSGGEARRVALARALSADPDVLLLDEPFGGLDVSSRTALLDDAATLAVHGRSGRPRGVVVVTHDAEEVLAIADRVLVLVQGRLAQQGPVEDVFGRPADETVAEIVGAENILFGRARRISDGVSAVEIDEVTFEAAGVEDVTGEVVAVIRPEAITILPQEAGRVGSARNLLHGVVRSVQRRSRVTRVVVDVGSVRLAAAVVPGSVDELGLSPGRQVGVSIKATAVHVLPRHPSSRG